MTTYVAIVYHPPGATEPLCIVRSDDPDLLRSVAHSCLSEMEAQTGSPGSSRETTRKLRQLRSLFAVLLPEQYGKQDESTIVM
ncbi:MAG: hypothetical protein A3H27_09420 [Acidobacteria bacterium RIFCSPLOWO2_02_FULL_59_13]|nr:MAG: hypothetical protein A3H27_09420 [Acidobacteria bacterium RIFCSPLOWO2_02_FULL_59_13]